jgi:hypothetical protein
LQYFRECFQDTILILNTNLEILEGLRALLKSFNERSFQLSADRRRSLEEGLRVCVSRFTMYRRWAETSLVRVQSISDLVRTFSQSACSRLCSNSLNCVYQIQALLGYRNDASTSQNSANIATLAEASGNDSKTMLLLTNATKRDSGIMRLIAVITMVYLPGTFMAVSSSFSFPTSQKDLLKFPDLV